MAYRLRLPPIRGEINPPASPLYLEKAVTAVTTVTTPTVADPYAESMEVALAALKRPDYPAGLLLWLVGDANPRYAELTERLPAQVLRLWTGRAPLEGFQRVLDRFVETHREACALYRAHLSRKKNGSG